MQKTPESTKVAVIGSTGYAGAELVRILAQHPQVELVALTSTSYAGQPFNQAYPAFGQIVETVCEPEDWTALAETVDVIFCALPHGHAAEKIKAEWLADTDENPGPSRSGNLRIIDLGADFRLRSADDYAAWYGLAHPNPALLEKAVYGLTEWNRAAIAEARLIANPGCYPTCSALAVAPLLRHGLIETNSVIIDAKSGISGAGRALGLDRHYGECSESIKAYGLASHRHTPEIEQTLADFAGNPVPVTFTPHLVPMNRGILATVYAHLTPDATEAAIRDAYAVCYADEPFIRLLPPGVYPETRWVKGSNFCDIGVCMDARTRRVIVVAAIDNLVKGAAGQAVQNMNRMLGFDERTGLETIPLFVA
jgi:N-acetyl-gamma-glutamyl-phosphate reductase